MRRSGRWFINAAPYFEALLEVLPLAKRSVYIADWHGTSPPLWVVVGFACTDLSSPKRVTGGRAGISPRVSTSGEARNWTRPTG